MNTSSPNAYHGIGIMSGTSLDGVDLAYCIFTETEKGWNFDVKAAKTVPYTSEWLQKLRKAEQCSGLELVMIDMELGHYIGKETLSFIQENNIKADFAASHGHTIFHCPQEGYTTQIGNGSAIKAHVKVPVVFDFRVLDVALGGQGAPLVPMGDALLFSAYDYCLNLGGISNISYQRNGLREAYDISLCNIPLNYLAHKMKLEYDKDGALAASGTFHTPLFESLNALAYFHTQAPKSLGKEWFNNSFLPLLKPCSIPIPSLLRTVTEHIAFQIAKVLADLPSGKLIITGGGTFNRYLIERLKAQVYHQVIIPDALIINYKEALIFAFLGLLKLQGKVTALPSVTGAREASSGGCIV